MARDANQVLNDIGMGSYQWVQLLLLGGIMISDGAEIMVSSSVLGALRVAWNLTPMVRGAMMSVIFMGVFIGGLIGGNIGDTRGRRRAIICSYVGIILFGTVTAAAQGPLTMMLCRFFFGASFGCGMGPALTLQVETAPTAWRAHMVNFGSVWFTIGEVYTAALLIVFMPYLTDPTGTHWRWVTLFSMVPGLLLFPFTCLLLQESPHFLLAQGRHSEAVQSLQYIAHMNNQAQIAESLDSDDPDQRLCLPTTREAAALVPQQASSSASASDVRRSSVSSTHSTRSLEVRLQETEEEQENAKRVTVSESLALLLGPENRSIVIGGAYLCFLGNFLFYGLTYALPQIFSSLGKELSPAFQVLIVSVCDIPGVGLAFLFIYSKSIGHRDGLKILAGSAAVFSLTLISIDHGATGLYVGLPSAYLVKYIASAFFTLAYVYLSEVFPAKVRSSGISLCIAAGRVGSMVAPLIVESLHDKSFKLGAHAPFLMLTSALCLIGIAMIQINLHFELKNEPLRDAPSESPASEVQKGSKGGNGERRSSRLTPDPDVPAPAG